MIPLLCSCHQAFRDQVCSTEDYALIGRCGRGFTQASLLILEILDLARIAAGLEACMSKIARVYLEWMFPMQGLMCKV